MCVCEAKADVTLRIIPAGEKNIAVSPIFWLKLEKQSVESTVFRHNRRNGGSDL